MSKGFRREVLRRGAATVRAFGGMIVDVLFPHVCVLCSCDGAVLCDPCLQHLHQVCSHGQMADGFWFCHEYNQHDAVSRSIFSFKYKFVKDLAQPLAGLMVKELAKFPELQNGVLTFVPLHKKRRKWRGYNQSELLARELAASGDMRFDGVERLLERVSFSRPQMGLEREERLRNMRDAFVAAEGAAAKVKGRSVFVVDDVATTGATLAECAKVLKAAGADRVFGIVLARSLL